MTSGVDFPSRRDRLSNGRSLALFAAALILVVGVVSAIHSLHDDSGASRSCIACHLEHQPAIAPDAPTAPTPVLILDREFSSKPHPLLQRPKDANTSRGPPARA